MNTKKVIRVSFGGPVSAEITWAAIQPILTTATKNKKNWAAEQVRDSMTGKLIAVNVNLPSSVTANEHSNAVAAITANRGVASCSPLPIAVVDKNFNADVVGQPPVSSIAGETYASMDVGAGAGEILITDEDHYGANTKCLKVSPASPNHLVDFSVSSPAAANPVFAFETIVKFLTSTVHPDILGGWYIGGEGRGVWDGRDPETCPFVINLVTGAITARLNTDMSQVTNVGTLLNPTAWHKFLTTVNLLTGIVSLEIDDLYIGSYPYTFMGFGWDNTAVTGYPACYIQSLKIIDIGS